MAKQFIGALDVLGLADPYGTESEKVGGEMLIIPQLDACYPDPNQPRRVLPDDLGEQLLGGAPAAEMLWEAWRRCLREKLCKEMRAHDLSPAEALAKRRKEGMLDGSTELEVLALQLTLEGLVELAHSIARRGLRQLINCGTQNAKREA